MDIEQLVNLTEKVRNHTATKAEKDTWMAMLYNEGRINRVQYEKYLQGRNTDEIIESALGIAAIFLVGYLLLNLFGKK